MTTFTYSGAYQWNFYNQSSQNFTVNMDAVVDTDLFTTKETLANPGPNGLTAYLVNYIVPPSDAYDGNFQASQTIVYTADNGGNITLAPGQTLIFDGYNHVSPSKAFDLSLEGVETINIGGEWLLCTYTPNNRVQPWLLGEQYVNLLGENGFTITENIQTQNNVTGNGVEIGLGGGGYYLNTKNICFQVTDSVAGWLEGIGNINNLYLAAFGRTADQGGLTYWNAKLDGGLSKIDLTNIFLSSDEYNTLHKSNEDFIKELYVDLLERNGETGGLQSWIGALDSGVSRAVVVNAFTHSAEFVQLVGQVAPAAAAPLAT